MPVLVGVCCRLCGHPSLLIPWDVTDGYRCRDCGAVNHWPLMQAVETYPKAKYL